MWRTPNGDNILTGPVGLLFANGLRSMADEMRGSLEYGEDYGIGIRAFDSLTTEQKIWSIHKATFGLLDENTPPCPLVAYLEATIAGIFEQIESGICIEIDLGEEDDSYEFKFHWRQLVLDAFELTGMNAPENLEDDETPLVVESTDIDQWKDALGYIEEEVFWDDDYLYDDFNDYPPEAHEEVLTKLRIADDYYSSIPPDPSTEEAEKLLKEFSDFCDEVIKREGNPK